jgi:hypothetical protein
MWCKDFDIFQVWRTGENFSFPKRVKVQEFEEIYKMEDKRKI